MKGDDKICTVCGQSKRACREKLGIRAFSRHNDPRGFSSPAGLRQFSDEILTRISKGNAGEGVAMEIAEHILEERQHNRRAAERCPLWALSPFEQELHRAKGTPLKQAGSYFSLTEP